GQRTGGGPCDGGFWPGRGFSGRASSVERRDSAPFTSEHPAALGLLPQDAAEDAAAKTPALVRRRIRLDAEADAPPGRGRDRPWGNRPVASPSFWLRSWLRCCWPALRRGAKIPPAARIILQAT